MNLYETYTDDALVDSINGDAQLAAEIKKRWRDQQVIVEAFVAWRDQDLTRKKAYREKLKNAKSAGK